MTPRDVSRHINVRIDSAIDNAAAQLTHAKPSDALRANVMSRIAVEKPARFPWRFVFAAGALASVALVVMVSRAINPAMSNSTISNPTPVNPAVLSASTNPTGGATTASPLASGARTAAHDGGQLVLATLSDADQEWLNRTSVPALEHPELMTIKPLSESAPVKAIDIEPIRVAPLVVSAIGDDNQ